MATTLLVHSTRAAAGAPIPTEEEAAGLGAHPSHQQLRRHPASLRAEEEAGALPVAARPVKVRAVRAQRLATTLAAARVLSLREAGVGAVHWPGSATPVAVRPVADRLVERGEQAPSSY